jgi:hypothetical protein
MKDQKRNIINLLCTSIIIVLIFLLFSAFSDKPVKKTDNTIQYALISEFHSENSKAVIAYPGVLPSLQKSFIYKPNQLFNESHKIFTDNRKINQSFILLQKIQLSIKPIAIWRFYYHPFSKDDDDWLILS